MRRGRAAQLAGRARAVSATETATWTGSFPRLRGALYNPLRCPARYRVTARVGASRRLGTTGGVAGPGAERAGEPLEEGVLDAAGRPDQDMMTPSRPGRRIDSTTPT